jgi:energy-coupling factor transporter ATP-binding protein EcfA2
MKRSARKPPPPPAPVPAARSVGSRHDRNVAASAAWNRAQSAAGREIGTIPPVGNPQRRSAAEHDFRTFCETYLAPSFPLAWSDDHLRMIHKIEAAVLRGELFAFAMPRGSGKTTLIEAAALWALLHGHRQFVAVIGADEGHARRLVGSMWSELETNDELLDDFPEVVFPIRRLERISQRARGQLHHGEPTRMERTAGAVILPTVAGSKASGSVLWSAGITGSIRGMASKRADGVKVRPDLVLIDDPATDEVSASATQVASRLEVMTGAILGLAGPRKRIAGLCAITVIRPNDLADQLLDRAKHPAWQGERASLVYEWPADEGAWDRYAELRRDGQRTGEGTAAATEFYREHREQMDAGSRVAWPERHNPDELSALQHAYNLRIDRGEAAFASEFQNSPLLPKLETASLDRTALQSRAVNVPRGVMPSSHNTLTLTVDVQQRVLIWSVVSWGPGFSGHVVAYGAFPDQGTAIFNANAARRTLADRYRGHGFEAALLAGLGEVISPMLLRDWPREDGTTQRIGQVLVDANWGNSTATVREFARRHASAAIILPAHGRGIGATSRPLNEHAKKRGEMVGPGWRVGMVGGQRGLLFDSNFWKSFVAGRLRTPVGDVGAVTLHAGQHDLLIEHLLSESPVTVEARGRVVEEWRLTPGRENHLLDALTMAAVAASITGISAVGAEPLHRKRRKVEIPQAGQRRRIEVKRLR